MRKAEFEVPAEVFGDFTEKLTELELSIIKFTKSDKGTDYPEDPEVKKIV